MESPLTHEITLSKKYEEILKKRTRLLQEMECLHEKHKDEKNRHAMDSEAAKKRNAELLHTQLVNTEQQACMHLLFFENRTKDLQNLESRLKTRSLPHPDIVTLETRYWASVEKRIPEWEPFLLGRGSPPARDGEDSPRKMRTKKGSSHDRPPKHTMTSLPPLSNPKTVI